MYTTSISDFKKEKVLGKGSFGSVYLVRRRQDNKIYALKTVILEKLSKKEQENSVNEVRILASINHPNVIGYKEAFWDDAKSSLNIVMEYADDGDLHTKIEKMKKNCGYFKEPLIWSYAIQMIEGLKALHDKKIMHRDLKSANIFLVKDKHQCKLGDMNVSKVIKEKVLHTQTGTPYYASPEVWNDAPYSYKSDLWSIGCVIYELCQLRPPFQGKDLDELYENVCKGKPERIDKSYSDELWKMIMMLLQVDVKKRVDCNMFLNSDLIKKKMQEMKNDPNCGIESFIYSKNKDNYDNYLLDTIKFSDIKEIKAQLPTKKNYNSNIFGNKMKLNKSNKLIKKGKNKDSKVNISKDNKDAELSRKIKEKQQELEKMKLLLNKNNKNDKKDKELNNKDNNKDKIKKKKIVYLQDINNNIKESKEKSLKQHKSIIYKKNNNSLSNNIVNTEKSININPEIIISNLKSYKKSINTENPEQQKKVNKYKLYLKKYANKVNHANINLAEERCKTPLSNYGLLLHNKLSTIPRSQKNNSLNNKKLLENCLTFVDRKKDNKYMEEISEIENDKKYLQNSQTLEISSNKNNSYIYNKPTNLIIKKSKSLTKNSKDIYERSGSATPIYKRAKNISSGLFNSNIPISYSFITKNNSKNDKNCGNINLQNRIPKIIKINSPIMNKRKKNENKNTEGNIYLYKLNKYFSYEKVLTTPSTNNSNNSKLKEIKDIKDIKDFKISNKKNDINNNNINKYIKKLNVKSYQQKLKELKNDNFAAKKEHYGNIYERQKKEEKNKKINYNENLRNNKSNIFTNQLKSINIKEGINHQILNCYLSPKNIKSQIFNNFYSINSPVPVKVINVYKK